MIWTLNEKDIDFADLAKDQGCNHFENITTLTTKRGFCDLLRDVHWNSQDSQEISPRCYNLGDPIHRDEFIDDFRLTAAVNILKWYVLHVQHDQTWCNSRVRADAASNAATVAHKASITTSSFPSSSSRPSFRSAPKATVILPPALKCDGVNTYTDSEMLSVLQDATTACVWYLRVNKHGEWPEVDISRCERISFSFTLNVNEPTLTECAPTVAHHAETFHTSRCALLFTCNAGTSKIETSPWKRSSGVKYWILATT